MPCQQPNKVRRFGGQWNTSFDSQATTSFQSDSLSGEEREESFDSVKPEFMANPKDFMKQCSKDESNLTDTNSRRRRNSFAIVE